RIAFLEIGREQLDLHHIAYRHNVLLAAGFDDGDFAALLVAFRSRLFRNGFWCRFFARFWCHFLCHKFLDSTRKADKTQPPTDAVAPPAGFGRQPPNYSSLSACGLSMASFSMPIASPVILVTSLSILPSSFWAAL